MTTGCATIDWLGKRLPLKPCRPVRMRDIALVVCRDDIGSQMLNVWDEPSNGGTGRKPFKTG